MFEKKLTKINSLTSFKNDTHNDQNDNYFMERQTRFDFFL